MMRYPLGVEKNHTRVLNTFSLCAKISSTDLE
jgi:hypothetical protein